MHTIKRIDIDPSLEFLRATITTWVDRLGSVSKIFPQCESKYYLEPTLVGLLAGSAWANDLPAITEKKIKRIANGSPEKSGRLDLLIQKGELCIALEAKLIWDCELSVDHVRESLAEACSEVKSISDVNAQILLGGVFFVPWWNNGDQKRSLKIRTVDRYDDLKADVKACYYDPAIEYPGAIFAAKVAGSD
jgi:hypothetical protein